jgi:hypothetical protein
MHCHLQRKNPQDAESFPPVQYLFWSGRKIQFPKCPSRTHLPRELIFAVVVSCTIPVQKLKLSVLPVKKQSKTIYLVFADFPRVFIPVDKPLHDFRERNIWVSRKN